MITISTSSSIDEIIGAVKKANEILNDQTFFAGIKAHPQFDLANAEPSKIAELIQNSQLGMTVELYRSSNRRVFGYDDPAHPSVIHINSNRNEFNIPALTNTMIHEMVHAVDSLYSQYEFGHGDNSSFGKANTAPYWIGKWAEELAGGPTEAILQIHEGSPEAIEEIAIGEEPAGKKKTDWHSIARVGTLVAKLLIYLCIFLITSTWTISSIDNVAYRWCFVGIELALLLSSALTTIRLGTNKPFKKYANPGLLTKNKQLINLLSLITLRIKEYNQSADYYFSGVRIYKYFTMILSGISTVLLGLNLDKLLTRYGMTETDIKLYPEVTKNIAFIIGAIITVYTGIMAYWNIEKYWLQNRSIANKLTVLKEEIENEDKAGKLNPETIQKKYETYEKITGEYFKYWEGALSGRAATEKNA